VSSRLVRVGDVLRLERFPIEPEPSTEYISIGVRSFGKGIFHYEPTTGAQLGSLRFYTIKPGCLVISNIKGWEGAVAVAGINESECIASNRFLTYVPNDECLVDINWARWYFLSEQGNELLQKASPGSADRNRTLAIERFEKLEIPLPSIEVQREVAGSLDVVAKAASNIAERQFKQKLRIAALSSGLVRGDHSEVALGQVVRIVRRPHILDPSTEYSLVGCRWYGQGLFIRERKLGRDVAAKTLFRIEAGDLVYNRLFAWKGSFAVCDDTTDGCFVSGEFPTFEIDENLVSPIFLRTVLGSRAFLDQVDQRSTGSTPTSRNRLKEAEFLDCKVSLPPLSEQLLLAKDLDLVIRTRSLIEKADLLNGNLIAAAINHSFADLASSHN
jgi:type I restriction enzyme, S subunit